MNLADILDEAFPESFCDTQNRRFWELLVSGLAAEKIHPVDLCTNPTMPGVPTSPLPHTLSSRAADRYLVSSKVHRPLMTFQQRITCLGS